jgi:hypothetical protein
MEAVALAVATLLLACGSIYLGTGVTLVFFLFPIQPRLTPETYRLPFVDPVQNATRFFTIMTSLMLTGATGLVVLELGTSSWIAPAAYLVLTIASTLLTTRVIFPHNKRMTDGITDPEELQRELTAWRRLHTWRACSGGWSGSRSRCGS